MGSPLGGLFLLLFLGRVSLAVNTRRIRGEGTPGSEHHAHTNNQMSMIRPQHVPSFMEWDGAVLEHDDDPLKQVRALLDLQESQKDETALVEVDAGAGAGVGKVHAFCEICILIMQMKERGQPHLCAGLNPDYFITCVENLESILRADKAVTYWLRSGCLHLDREGPEVVKPCPAHAICAWVPNLFADVGVVSPRNELAPLCPRDFKYLPRIPRKPAGG